jgi:hypothetical protein
LIDGLRNIKDAGQNIEIGWDGDFTLDGDGFVVASDHPEIGNRVIYGYPLHELRQAIGKG